MEQRSLNAFGAASPGAIDRHVRLAIARNLARIYEDVLREPLPGSLRNLLDKLEGRRG
jgi:hypothetical protein